ncbi:ATP-grasp domain-containing protein [Streptomyces sp. NPDC048442]|uniref:ATP-grasp domain-containing protein n=1 Tax=Streptomyces sp. NPDC048442 TaxID=3154823 RepID=UPI003436909E
MSESPQPLVLFLGNARYGEFEPLRETGARVGLIRDVSSHGWSAPDDAFDVVIPWNPADGVEGLSAGLPHDGSVCVLNLREAYVEEYARLCAVLALPALDPADVAALRSKHLMRQLFRDGIGADSTGRFEAVVSAAEVVEFGETHGWPVVLKPATLYSSLFVVTVTGPQDAATVFARVQDGVAAHVRAKQLPERFTALQVEEFLAGSNHSVDLVVDREGVAHPSPVVDVLTGADLGGEDFHHFARYAPSRAPAPAQRQMADLAVQASRAMGLRLCAAHVEFILTPQGPRLLEVGIRPGGHRARVLREAHGVSFMAAYAAVMRGEAPDLERKFDRPFGIVTPFPRATGTFEGLHAPERLTGLASYRSHSVYHSPGKTIGTAAQGHWQVLSAELVAGTTAELVQDMEQVWEMTDLVAVRTTPGPGPEAADAGTTPTPHPVPRPVPHPIPHLLLIGGKDSGFASIAELDIRITLLQERAHLTARQTERADTLIVYDRLDAALAESTALFLHEQHGSGPFDAVLSFAEQHLLTAARIGERLSIVHNPLPAVRDSRDKLLTRALLDRHGLQSVPYRSCRSLAEATAFQAELAAPVVLKPAAGSGSRGVRLVDGPAGLAPGWEYAAADGAAVIAEEYIPGPEVSVETLTLDGKHEILAVTEKITTGAPSFVETGHQLPASLAPAVQEAVTTTTTALLDALGHQWGPAHTEFRIREDGRPVLIETQTRFGGDQIWQMVELVTGVRLAKATAAAMLGVATPRDAPTAQAAAIRFFAYENTVVRAIDGPDDARGLPGVVTVQLSARVGQELGPLAGSGSRQGYVLATGADRQEAVERAEAAHRAVKWVVDE